MFPSISSLLLAAILGLRLSFAAPVDDLNDGALVARNISKRSIPAAPRYVVYSDAFVSSTNPAPATSAIAGWTVFNIAFLTNFNADNYGVWVSMTPADRASVKAQYAAAGIKLCVAAFGSTEEPTNAGLDPIATADSIAAAVIEYDLDGVDVDYEDFDAFNRKDGSAEAWLISFTTELRKKLPSGEYIITHAPVAPWFISELYNGKGYSYVNQQVGNLIDWYNVQFYNQGVTEYTTCAGLLSQSSSTWPGSSVFEIAARGVPLDKIVIGKPAAANNANNGLMTTSLLASCAAEAVSNGWNAGIMSWQYPDASSAWIQAVKVGMSGVTGPTSTISTSTIATTTTSTAVTSPTAGSCANMATWSSSTIYTAGVFVVYEGFLWKANQWNDNEVPGGASGAWDKVFAC